MSAQGPGGDTRRRWREICDALELDLLAARKTGDVIAVPIPYGPDHTTALGFVQGAIDALRDRGLSLDVNVRRTPEGVAYFIEDVTP